MSQAFMYNSFKLIAIGVIVTGDKDEKVNGSGIAFIEHERDG